MEYPIFNIMYETCAIAYPIATVSDQDERKAVQRLEKHIIKNDSMEGRHLGFKVVKVINTGVYADLPRVLNSNVIGNRKGELDSD